MIDFSTSFRDIIIEKGTSVQEISKKIGIDDSVLYDYLHGATPNVDFAVKLANYFDCSINYLMGIDKSPNQIIFKNSYNITLFSDRYDNLLKENNVTHYKLYREKRLNYSSHYSWQHGAIPSMKSLYIIAEYFDVSIDYLIGRSDSKFLNS